MEIQQPGWRRSVRWFLAEFIVVVSGILVALAAQAWYGAARDARLERGYVQQLISDLDGTLQQLQLAVSDDSLRADANRRFVEALHRTQPLVADSARAWLEVPRGISYYSDPRPVMGTVTTLIQTGDIKLIENQAVRSKIVAYAAWMSADMEELSRNVNRLVAANDVERRQWEQHGLVTPTWYLHDAGESYRQYLAAWPIIKEDAALRSAVQVRFIVFSNRVWYLRRMQETTTELRALLSNGYSLK
jgi:hypothetical protein